MRRVRVRLGKFDKSPEKPIFDFHHNARLEDRNFSPDHQIAYAPIVTAYAKWIADLVLRKYATQLEALRLMIEIRVRSDGARQSP